MARLIVRALVVVALVSAGWVAGRAQTPSWDFEISVDAPAGETTVTCVRGCSLAWVERSVPGDPTLSAGPETFRYGCRSATGRCQSGRVGGWIVKPASAR
jgi:hypothetical protein